MADSLAYDSEESRQAFADELRRMDVTTLRIAGLQLALQGLGLPDTGGQWRRHSIVLYAIIQMHASGWCPRANALLKRMQLNLLTNPIRLFQGRSWS